MITGALVLTKQSSDEPDPEIKPTAIPLTGVPPIDKEQPLSYQTATFALG